MTVAPNDQLLDHRFEPHQPLLRAGLRLGKLLHRLLETAHPHLCAGLGLGELRQGGIELGDAGVK